VNNEHNMLEVLERISHPRYSLNKCAFAIFLSSCILHSGLSALNGSLTYPSASRILPV
jgi:hypothetical protein